MTPITRGRAIWRTGNHQLGIDVCIPAGDCVAAEQRGRQSAIKILPWVWLVKDCICKPGVCQYIGCRELCTSHQTVEGAIEFGEIQLVSAPVKRGGIGQAT